MLFVVFFNKIIVYITKSCVLYNACNLVYTLYTSFLTPQAKWYLVSSIKFVNQACNFLRFKKMNDRYRDYDIAKMKKTSFRFREAKNLHIR